MSINLSISPQQIEYIIKPGATIIQSYKIRNDSDAHVFLTPTVEPWKALGDDGLVSYQNVDQNTDVTFELNNSDLSLNTPFQIEPNSEKQLVLKIKASPQTKESDYYSTFFITQSESLDKNEYTKTQTTAKIGSHILLSISNTQNSKDSFEIKDFKASPRFKDIIFNKINFSSNVENKSSHFYKINGDLIIEKNNLEISKTPLSQLNVLSHSNRKIYCSYQSSDETANCHITPPFWPGKYTATISLSSDTASKSASLDFFVFPYYLCLFILIISVIIFTIFFTKKATA